MLKYGILCLYFVLAVVSPASAVDTLQVQTSDPILDDWRWTTFDTDDGLVDNVGIVYEDGDNMWFGSARAGVQKYDGSRWTTYTVDDGLVHNEVRAMVRCGSERLTGSADCLYRKRANSIGPPTGSMRVPTSWAIGAFVRPETGQSGQDFPPIESPMQAQSDAFQTGNGRL